METKTIFVQLTGIVILVFVAVIGCKESTETPKSSPPDEISQTETPETIPPNEFVQMYMDLAKALNDKDVETATLQYAEDASFVPPNEPIVTGRENIKKYWQSVLDAGTTSVSVTFSATSIGGDLGNQYGTFRLSYPGPDGKMMVIKGKFVELLKRTADGKWVSYYGNWNLDLSTSE
jgi:ketosteroid isomerase-like protein